jgi:hypothetical protein
MNVPNGYKFKVHWFKCVPCREATNTILIVFGFTRPGIKPTIYLTRGEHANHYAIDAVDI